MQPPGRGPKGGVARHRSAAGMRVAAQRAVPLCLRVQREAPHHHSQPRLLLPVRQLCWQQPAREGGAAVRFTPLSDQRVVDQRGRSSLSPSSHWSRWSRRPCDLCAQAAREDPLSVELHLGAPQRLHQPSVPAGAQPGAGAPPALHRPLLFQVGSPFNPASSRSVFDGVSPSRSHNHNLNETIKTCKILPDGKQTVNLLCAKGRGVMFLLCG